MSVQRVIRGARPASTPVAASSALQRAQAAATSATASAREAAKPAPPKRRFIGGITTKPSTQSAAKLAVAANLQLIATIDTEVDQLLAQRDAALAQIDTLMRTSGLTHEEAAGWQSIYEEQFSRSSTTVRPADFRAAVSEEQFMECVDIPLNRAQKFLGEKELERISDIVPRKSLGFRVVTSKIKTKVTRK